MREFLAIGAASVALFGASQAMAADSTVTYDIGTTCEVGGLVDIDISEPITATPPVNRSIPMSIICDDPGGAILTLTTANGGVQHTLDSTTIVNYQAVVAVPQSDNIWNGSDFPNLTTDGTAGATDTTIVLPSANLAAGVGVPSDGNSTATLVVLFSEPFPFSGTYTDTLSIDITGN
ncbi:MAG: hypothetical protein ACR2QH_04690 [Geminicoccaceae bacterium]